MPAQATEGAPPRVAMSFALADAQFERPAFAAEKFLPFPPLQLRVSLRAAQAITYHTQVRGARGCG